ncbi:MAG: hypothetical protein ACK55F_03190 [Acidobacteriota bacterium]|jgi:hypothetical protein
MTNNLIFFCLFYLSIHVAALPQSSFTQTLGNVCISVEYRSTLSADDLTRLARGPQVGTTKDMQVGCTLRRNTITRNIREGMIWATGAEGPQDLSDTRLRWVRSLRSQPFPPFFQDYSAGDVHMQRWMSGNEFQSQGEENFHVAFWDLLGLRFKADIIRVLHFSIEPLGKNTLFMAYFHVPKGLQNDKSKELFLAISAALSIPPERLYIYLLQCPQFFGGGNFPDASPWVSSQATLAAPCPQNAVTSVSMERRAIVVNRHSVRLAFDTIQKPSGKAKQAP